MQPVPICILATVHRIVLKGNTGPNSGKKVVCGALLVTSQTISFTLNPTHNRIEVVSLPLEMALNGSKWSGKSAL